MGCDENWTGSDCSIYSAPTEPTIAYSGSVETTKWKFYYVNVQGPATIEATLTQTVTNTQFVDLDLFVQKNTFPSFLNYLEKEINDDATSVLRIEEASGLYYFGIFGYQGGEYTFSYTVTSPCKCAPNQGECIAGSSVCQCFSGYAGDTCNVSYTKTESGAQNAKINGLGWYYYGIEVNAQSRAVLFELMLGGDEQETHKADLYVAANRPPTRYDFDHATPDQSSESLLKIQITMPATPTVFFFAVHARQASTFHVKATVYPIGGNVCVNNCSNHGTCSNGRCFCNIGFNGLSCEQMISPLMLGQSQTGFVSQGAWNFYWIHMNTLNDILVTITEKSQNSDCDLYAKKNLAPNFFNYDYVELSSLSQHQLLIPNPGESVWKFGVYGFKDCVYELTVNETAQCECLSESHGTCQGSNVCVCDAGWGGPLCTMPFVPVQSGTPLTSITLGRNEWKYFTFPVSKASAISVALKEKTTLGSIWMYVGIKQAPSLASFYDQDRTLSSLHQIDIVQNFEDDTIVIGAYGSPYIIGEAATFDLLAWNAPF